MKVTPRLILLVPLFAFGLALGINLYVRKEHQPLTDLLPRAPADKATATALKPMLGLGAKPLSAADRLSDSLLTDSILSIVQSYYVDPERVDNKSLVLTAFNALSSNPRVKSGVTGDSVWIEIDGQRRSFAMPETPRYQDVLDTFSTVAQLLDAAGIEVAAGEVPEKGAPGAVILLNSMLAELDAHSALLSPDAYKELRQGTEGAFGGLGVLVGIRENLLTVIKPLPRSPAQRAGIKKHDRILGIDGVDTYGYSLDELVEYMRGDPGTDVKLSLLREGAPGPSEINLRREVIHVDSVQVKEIVKNDLKVLHLTVENFASRTSREVMNAIKQFREKHGGKLSGLVLDLRSNPGGLLDQAVQMADLFLQSGVIVSTKGRREEIESAGSGIDEMDYPVTVLIDGDSASASEIVAGALQDHGRAVVIGQPSFGKGSVQTIFELPGERALKLTIARYYTPVGRSIQNVGIIPDVWLQPVSRAAANENLFGPYRYKNERFLRNHLELAAESETKQTELARLQMHLPVRKAYYLEGDLDSDDNRINDHELNLALQMIRKIRDTYGDKIPDGTNRASHWLGLAGPVVNGYADKLDQEASAFIAKSHKLDWGRASDTAARQTAMSTSDVRMELGNGENVKARPGETVKIPYKLISQSEQRLDRLSVFARSDMPGFDTRETLVGSLAAAATKAGELEVWIPNGWEPGPLLLRIGIASDAWPSRNGGSDLLITVEPRETPELRADVNLVAETVKVDGALETKEKAKLRISLVNAGTAVAKALTVRVINLSGSQVVVDSAPREVSELVLGVEKDVFVSIEGGKALFAPDLNLGLLVESADLKAPLRQRFTVHAHPNAKPTKVSNLLGH